MHISTMAQVYVKVGRRSFYCHSFEAPHSLLLAAEKYEEAMALATMAKRELQNELTNVVGISAALYDRNGR